MLEGVWCDSSLWTIQFRNWSCQGHINIHICFRWWIPCNVCFFLHEVIPNNDGVSNKLPFMLEWYKIRSTDKWNLLYRLSFIHKINIYCESTITFRCKDKSTKYFRVVQFIAVKITLSLSPLADSKL